MEKILFDKGWKFKIEDLEPHCPESGWGGAKVGAYDFGATAKDCNEEDWKNIDLPYENKVEVSFDDEKNRVDIAVCAQIISRAYKDKDITVNFVVLDEKKAMIVEKHVLERNC